MVCGRDYHGNAVGIGCGHGFRWTEAPQYVPRTGEDPAKKDITLAEPEQVRFNVICMASNPSSSYSL